VSGRPILTAAEMRAAEAKAIAGGVSEQALMERAGEAAARAIRLHAGPMPELILCGPGNNGGDGYVIARRLAEDGMAVRVAASAEPSTPAARVAREAWNGPVEDIATAAPASLLVDALFGTGLTRPLDAGLIRRLQELAAGALLRVAIDLPSGAASDDGSLLSPVPDYDLTISFQTLKPSHLLQPAARHMGRLVIADIGIQGESGLVEIARPKLSAPRPDAHKYSRGYAAVIGGEMAGAASLAATAALRVGAGYVRLFGSAELALPLAVVRSSDAAWDDPRIGAVLVGPGLGRDARAAERLGKAIGSGRPLILDADALILLTEQSEAPPPGSILTPHAGEFARMFGELAGNKVEQAREAAARTGCTIIYKGPDTVVAEPGGRAAIARPAPSWLASAGTGDVLAGMITGLCATGHEPFEAACAAVWLHGRSAELAGPVLIADDLLTSLPAAVAECL
jgi:hydroxyethylthiazole kinase-like uncharacterized protein yjeF